MKAEIKSFHSPDVWDLESWVPETTIFSVLLQLLIGPVGQQGEESFSVLMCSPGHIASLVEKTGIVDGRHQYVVSSWKWTTIHHYFQTRVRALEAET
ncbi:MAG: immunity 8 family protein [Propionibacteriaceae bacterium]|nr:immunity 8 family protein [Propionibacteriaceae bacterium]